MMQEQTEDEFYDFLKEAPLGTIVEARRIYSGGPVHIGETVKLYKKDTTTNWIAFKETPEGIVIIGGLWSVRAKDKWDLVKLIDGQIYDIEENIILSTNIWEQIGKAGNIL